MDGAVGRGGGEDAAATSLTAIDAQIQNKIGLLEGLLGSCDGVLRRHDVADDQAAARALRAPAECTEGEEVSPAHRSHPGNPVGLVQQQAPGPVGKQTHECRLAPDGAAHLPQAERHEEGDGRGRSLQQEPPAPTVGHLIEAARLLRAQRVSCRVTRQMCSVHHMHCALPSLRIHRLAERKIRGMASVAER